MAEIVRTKTSAEGGVTDEERVKLEEIAQEWIKIAFRTDPIDEDKITYALKGLYRVVGLKEPRVVVVSSPLAMAATYGIAAADAESGTEPDFDRIAREISRIKPLTAKSVRKLIKKVGGAPAFKLAKDWPSVYQGGNLWAGWVSFVVSCRDVLGLDLQPELEAFKWWEMAAREGSFRCLHDDFVVVSDFFEGVSVDDRNRPHSETGPSHRWRDGWELYHWHGTPVPPHWINKRNELSPVEVLAEENVELRAAGAAIIGPQRMAAQLQQRIIDGDPNTDIGALVELTLPGTEVSGLFLMAQCPRNGTIVEGVPDVSEIDRLPITTAIAAQAWRDGLPQSEYSHPLIRT